MKTLLLDAKGLPCAHAPSSSLVKVDSPSAAKQLALKALEKADIIACFGWEEFGDWNHPLFPIKIGEATVLSNLTAAYLAFQSSAMFLEKDGEWHEIDIPNGSIVEIESALLKISVEFYGRSFLDRILARSKVLEYEQMKKIHLLKCYVHGINDSYFYKNIFSHFDDEISNVKNMRIKFNEH